MKKITIILPLLALLMTGCKTTESSEVSLPSSESSSSESQGKKEFDPTELNAIFGSDIYSKLPYIYSEDYELFDESSDDYPIDVYIDFFDWTEDDAVDYDDALLDAFVYDDDYGSIIGNGAYVYVYLDDVNYDYDVYGINIYTTSETGGGSIDPIEPIDKDSEIRFDLTVDTQISGDKNANLTTWAQDGLTMAIEKGSSTVNVGNLAPAVNQGLGYFSNPLRIYSGQIVTFTAPAGKSIDQVKMDVHVPDGDTKYIDGLLESGFGSADYFIVGDTVTFVLNPTTTTFVISVDGRQFRLTGVSVYFA